MHMFVPAQDRRFHRRAQKNQKFDTGAAGGKAERHRQSRVKVGKRQMSARFRNHA